MVRARVRAALLASVGLAVLSADPAAASGHYPCAEGLAPWTEIGLFLGRNIGGEAEVGEEDFQRFLIEVVTPRFPDGLTILDAAGQFRAGDRVVRERTKLMLVLVPDPTVARDRIRAIVEAYKRLFRQESVLRTEREVCLAFD